MNEVIRAAVDLVLADASTSGITDEPPYLDRILESYDGITVGDPGFTVMMADLVQEDIIENVLWPTQPTNWPVCPAHPRANPMKPLVVEGRAMWSCTDGTPYAQIGSLFASPHQARRARKRGK